mgnify:CR=1 FL=1
MNVKVKDLVTPSFQNHYSLMYAWEHMGLDHIDFESDEVIHVSRSSSTHYGSRVGHARS